MKKTTKVLSLLLLTVLLASCCVSLIACSGAKDALAAYIPSFANKTVKSDFTLPRTIGDNVKVSWKSDNPAIEVVKRNGEDYLAKVTLADTVQKVTLTVSASGAGSKDFTVNVQAINSVLFATQYIFPQDNLEVYADFALETSTEYNGKTATISWSVPDAYKEWLSIESNGTVCHVVNPAELTKVEITATFTYNGSSTSMDYTMYVTQPKSHRETVNGWYADSNVSIEISGYVVGIATAYSDSYNNVSMYVVDDDMCSGYYLFRSKGSASDGAALAPGVHVTISNATSTDYNGLWETTNSSTFVVDSDIPAKNIDELVYALDNDVISGSPALKWHTGSLISLTNWTVKKVAAASDSKSATLVTLTKGGADITIGYNNYMEGSYISADNKPSAELTAIKNKVATFNEGDVISVKGILSYYNGFQILPRSEADVTAGAADQAESTGTKVKAAIAAVEAAIVSQGLKDANGNAVLITSNKEFNLPTSLDGVEISYTETFDGSSTVIDGGKITVSPDKLQNTTIEVSYKLNGYETWTYFKVRSEKLDDAGKVAYVKANLASDLETNYTKAVQVTLPTSNEFDGLTVTWALKEAKSWASITAGVLSITLPAEQDSAVLVATIACGSVTDTLEITINVAAAPSTIVVFDPITAPAAGTYKFALYQANLEKWLYMLAEMDGNYIKTTDDAALAADVVLAEADGGWTIKVGGKFVEANEAGSVSQVKMADVSGGAWVWDADLGIFTWTISSGSNAGKVVYLGTYNTFATISASETYRISGNNASAVGVSQFVGHLGNLEVVAMGSFRAIKAPAAGTYKLSLYQEGLEKRLFGTGEMDGFYFATTEDVAAAADYVVAAVDGGYTITCNDKYVEIVPRTDGGKGVNVVYNNTQTAGKLWQWNAALGTFTMVSGNNDPEAAEVEYFLGTSGTFKTFSANAVSGAEGKYIGQLGTIVGGTASVEPEPDPETKWMLEGIQAAAAGTYKLGMYQGGLEVWLYLAGGMDGFYYATTENKDLAVDVVVAVSGEGYVITWGGKYLEIVPRTDGSKGVNVVFNDAQTAGKVWKWNDSVKTFTMVSGNNSEDADVEYFLGTSNTKTYKTLSACAVSAASSNYIAVFGSIVEDSSEPEPQPQPQPPVEGVLAKFTFGANDTSKNHTDGSGITDGEDYVVGTVNGYTLTLVNPAKLYNSAYDDKGNSCLKLGTSKAYASFSFTVADDVQYVKIYVARYKTYTSSVKVNGTQYDLEKNSNNGEYDVIVVDVRTNKTVTFETCEWTGDSNFNGRCMLNAIEWLSSLEA